VATRAGWRALFAPRGYGPSRVAPTDLLGPLAPAAGWVPCALALAFAALGYGLLRLSPWVPIAILLVFGSLGTATVVAMASGVTHGEPGVLTARLLKLAAIGALLWYLRTRAIQTIFAGSRGRSPRCAPDPCSSTCAVDPLCGWP